MIKAYVEQLDVALTKGQRIIQLDPSFKPQSILGALISYGGYMGGQPMMNRDGDYEADYGIAPQLNQNSDGTLSLKIFTSGSYSSRELKVIVFYQ